jgi:hypothetical protein
VHLPQDGQQLQGDRPVTGTDLDQVVSRLRSNGRNDTMDYARIVQEVLAEAFAGTVTQKVNQWLR